MTAQSRSTQRRGSVVIVVLWAMAIAALVTTGVQLFSFRQATLGREAVERVQARWAARGGIEYTLAVMTDHTLRPNPDDAFEMTRDMQAVSTGATNNATWDIRHHRDGHDWFGPQDEHAKININRQEEQPLLMLFDDISYDMYDAIKDWMDEDNDISTLGVEREYYQGLESPYEPRNGPLHTIGEAELIAGIWPEDFRGEDWNLNGRLDSNEDDGPISFPPDEPDGALDQGWSGNVTVYSVAGGATGSGQPRVYLRDAEPVELAKRLGITAEQAEMLIGYGQSKSNKLERLMNSGTDSSANGDANAGADSSGRNNRNRAGQNENQEQEGEGEEEEGQAPAPANANAGGPTGFTAAQIRTILEETCIEDPHERTPGKMNINTVPAPLLREILEEGMSLDEAITDEILYLRDSQPEGIVYLGDLKKIPTLNSTILDQLSARFTTTSNVFTISSRGRSGASGLEVEIVAVVDRSTVPVRILEYREQ
jgi:type II secretory pathway component PulK